MTHKTGSKTNLLPSIGQKWAHLATRPFFTILSLLLFSGLFYGLLIPWLHLYIDDWLWVWTWEKLGSAGLVKYFSTNRPIWGLFFQVSLPLLGDNVLSHHLFALLVRWASSLACWWLLLLLWPQRRDVAFFGALLFLVYPGFVLQSIALTYGHIFLVYTFFLLSLCFHLMALRSPRYQWRYHLLAMAFSLANLLSMEYFFTLELARPLLIWIVLEEKPFAERMRITFRQWAPYLAIWTGAVIWRTFFFQFQTHNYQFSLLRNLRTQPGSTIAQLGITILTDVWETSFGAWLPGLQRFAGMNWKQNNSLLTLVLIAAVFFSIVIIGYAYRKCSPDFAKRWCVQAIALGVTLMLVSGIPFWLTGLEVNPVLLHSRLTIPFILGVTILLTGLLALIKGFSLRLGLLAFAVATAAGAQFQNANDFRLDWTINRRLIWQIVWRIPDLDEGTTLLISDLRMNFANTEELANTAALSTQLNAIYPAGDRFPALSYYLLFARELDRSLPDGLQENNPLVEDNVTSEFQGSTSQVLAAEYSPSRCFRLLEPALDVFDETLSPELREAAALSNWKWIQTNSRGMAPPQSLFGREPAPDWCYYYEKIELARQTGDWQRAADLAEAAAAAGFAPRDAMEKTGLVEVYAHTGQWSLALQQSQGFDRDKLPVLCRLWARIAAATPSSLEKAKALQTISQPDLCPNNQQP